MKKKKKNVVEYSNCSICTCVQEKQACYSILHMYSYTLTFFLYPIYIFTNFHSFLFCRYIHRFDFRYYKYKYLGGAAATACPALISRIVSLTLFIICKQQKNCDCGSVFFLLFHSDPSIKNAQFHVDSFLVFIIGYHK